MPQVWIELPEINRKIAITTGFSSNGLGLGCHCGTISSVTAHLQAPYSSSEVFSSLAILSPTTPDEKIRSERLPRGHSYAGYYAPIASELELVNTHLEKQKITFDSISEKLCISIAESCAETPLWVLSDVINYKSPARHVGESYTKIPDSGILKFVYGIPTYLISRTSTFADYLIRHKVGYIFESPIVQNPAHRTWGGYSLNRAWFWIPPKHLGRTLGISAQYGQENFPTLENWKKIIQNDLQTSMRGIGRYATPQKISDENFYSMVFDDGVFPDEHRFERTAKEA